jgi:hypothetical protein
MEKIFIYQIDMPSSQTVLRTETKRLEWTATTGTKKAPLRGA